MYLRKDYYDCNIEEIILFGSIKEDLMKEVKLGLGIEGYEGI